MCGICGSTDDPQRSAVQRMNAAMVHRGPDDQGVYADPDAGAALGARRLSIIDVHGGHQPLSNEDGSVWAVLNGEIYNHPALQERLRRRGHQLATSTDTEVLVHLYEDFGEGLVHALEGMFAFAIWDARRRRLLVARDRFGEKPLFYRERDGHLTFASELTALRAGMGNGPVDLDPVVLDAYFVYGYVPGAESLLHGVRQLPPGCLLTWSEEDRRARTTRYWEPPAPEVAAANGIADVTAEAGRLLESSVRSRMISDVPLGVFLSGGLDSSLVAAIAARCSRGRIKTFTVGYDVGSVSETAEARRVAEEVDAEHHELILSEADVAEMVPSLFSDLDQPLADQALVAAHAVARFARREVTVVVGGEGADELFGGYPRYLWLSRAAKLDRTLPKGVARNAANVLAGVTLPGRARRLVDVIAPRTIAERHLDWVTSGRRHLRGDVYGDRLRGAAGSNGRLLDGLSERLAAMSEAGVAARLMRLDQTHWLPDDVLAKADRASMLTSLEVRTPFLHRELAELACTVPADRHVEDGGKTVLRSLLANELPRARGPRPKTAFRVPAKEWLRGPLVPVLSEQLEAGALYEEGWFDRDAVQALTRRHTAGQADSTHVLWPLLALGLWLDRLRGRDGR